MARRAAGEGTIRKRIYTNANGKNYKRWFARVTITWDGKKKTSKDGPMRETQEKAKEDLRRMQKLLAAGNIETQSKQRLADYLEEWLETVAVSKKYGTYRSYYQSLYTYVLPKLGHMRLDKIRKTHVQNAMNDIFKDARERGKDGRATVRKALAALRKALEDAAREEILPIDRLNPCTHVEIPSEHTREIEPWSRFQTLRLLAVARRTRHYAIIYTALTAGLREGELCGLRWSDLEPVELTSEGKRRTFLVIHIRKILVSVPKKHQEVADLTMQHLHGRYYLDTPKTKKSLASVMVAEDTLEVLEKHKAEQEMRKQNLASRWHEYDLVFPASNGVPQSPRNLLRDYKKLIEQAKIPELTFHDLRDTHSSRLQAVGVELAAASERLRHSRKSTTADKYTHTMSSSRLSAVKTMGELLEK